ncbi:MAG: sugar phosphate isomerase/epimerase family protein, partial [Isosphaeraceae bacterium]
VVSMIALGGWIDAEGEEYARVLDDCRRRFEQAAALGSPYIVASPPHGAVEIPRAAERYGELIRIGRQYGVKPSMEFLGFVEGVHTLESARAIAEGSGEPEATIVADVFHLIRGGGTIEDLLAIDGRFLSIFHINDLPETPPPREQTDADRVMLKEGIADLPRVIANLRTIGYKGPLSLELFNPRLWQSDPVEVAREGLDRLKSLIF